MLSACAELCPSVSLRLYNTPLYCTKFSIPKIVNTRSPRMIENKETNNKVCSLREEKGEGRRRKGKDKGEGERGRRKEKTEKEMQTC